MSNLYKNYIISINQGPTNICASCGGLFFKKSVKDIDLSKLTKKGINEDFLNKNLKKFGENTKLCHTCYNSIVKCKIPKLALINGLDFPEIPEQLLCLTNLEAMLISPRIPFMQIKPLGCDRQLSLKGAVVNVPVNIDTNVSVLPRRMDQTFTVELELKRKLQYKSSYVSETVRPAIVWRAAEWAVKQTLYQESCISLSDQNPNYYKNIKINNDLNEETAINNNHNIIDNWDETVNDLPINPGAQATLLLGEDDLANLVLAYAPGENKKPLPILYDENCEILSFPKIYCCQKRDLKVKLSYNEIVKSEIRRYDRRACDIKKLFFSFFKGELIKLNGSIQIALKKKRLGTSINLTAGMINNKTIVNDLIQHDDAFKVLRSI